ncbi:Bromodomain-containing protein [Pholiota conissans]|uniref:Bromodomain-containing protein n=1 Tax=Pholiota conissans TaxID=109636 RepID=A0A9P5ZIG3_9AGAR|nr:Bromodomain-containing protein [Pholiota conissans]
MSKREHDHINGTGENAGSRRSKRRREGEASSDVDVTTSGPIEAFKSNGSGSSPESAQQVKEKGMMLWTTVKDAVNKEGISISTPFLHRPPKRLYPDYYELIKQPIALDDIKRKLDHHNYSSLQDVKNDFELLVANAKQYNLAESAIVQDAKELLKLVHKIYSKMVPSDEDEEKKSPSLSRLMKARLEKLVAKKDSTGRTLSAAFMALPDKKEWAIYYKEIKHPQCLEAVYKHIKRKEYHSAAQFSADVELVFSNALTFNQEQSIIWNDAMTLRDYFRQLMSDLPPPYSLPEYTKFANKPSNKIKIKPPQGSLAATSSAMQQSTKQEQGSTPSLLLRVPAAHPSSSKATPQAPTPTPQVRSPLVPTGTSETTLPAVQAAKTPKPQSKPQIPPPGKPSTTKAATPQPPQTVSFIHANPPHYPRTTYVPPPPTRTPISAVATPPAFQAPPLLNSNSVSQSPAPMVLPLNRQLKSVNLRIQPTGRTLSLDHRDGVKSWAARLGPGESSIIISHLVYLKDEDEEESSADENDAEDDMDVDVEAGAASPKNGRRKGKGRGRGRPPKAVAHAAKPAASNKAAKTAKKKTTKVGQIQLKLNNFAVKEQVDTPGEWNIQLPVGSSTIEVGEVGGMIWKLYAERLPDA